MMHTFKGGMHITDSKAYTNKLPIQTMSAGDLLYYPLQQHVGVMLSPVVSVGDSVKIGQLIADSDAFISAPIHASVSGTVKDIGLYPHPSGVKMQSIVIENDHQDAVDPSVQPMDDYFNYTHDQLIKIIRDAGIVGMGGAGFPTHVKLSPPPDKKIDYVIVNGAECEPYLTSDHRVMLETPDDIIYGLKTLMYILGLKSGYIGIEVNKQDAIETLRKHIDEDEYKQINIVPLKTKYPQGSEKHLIKAITKRSVPSGGLPADVGAIVVNIDTCAAITRKLKTGMPLIRRIVTISGDAISTPKNVSVPIGVPFKELIENAGGFSQEPKKIIMGGPMMGMAQHNLDTPVVKGTSALLCLTTDVSLFDTTGNCIRCSRCVSACPMRLAPLFLKKNVLAENYEECERYNIMDCLECGLCSYVCPSRQHPLQYIRMGKAQITENKRRGGQK